MVAAKTVPALEGEGDGLLMGGHQWNSACMLNAIDCIQNAMSGRCKVLDAAADGYVRSEAVGCIILSPSTTKFGQGHEALPAAVLLRGSAVNQDGRSSSLTAPNGPAQQAVVRRALAAATATPAGVAVLHSAPQQQSHSWMSKALTPQPRGLSRVCTSCDVSACRPCLAACPHGPCKRFKSRVC